MELVKIRTEIFVAVGRFVGFSELGKKATPWGRTIHEPSIVGDVLVLVGFHATTAMERYL